MLFKKHIIKLIEQKYRNNPRYQLLPAKAYSYVDRKGRAVIVPYPDRWKRIDKNKEESKSLGNKRFDKNNEFSITVKVNDNTEVVISYEPFSKNFYITSNAYKFELIDLEENSFLKNPYKFAGKYQLITENKGKFVENTFFSLAIDKDDETKLNYLNFFASGDFIKIFDSFIYDLTLDYMFSTIPQYRHFLQLMLSFENSKILKNEPYKTLFKTLLFLDWVQNKINFIPFLETMFFYYSVIFGKDKLLKFFGWNKSDYKYLDKLTIIKSPIPIPKINLDTFEEAMKIIKEMYDETQELIKKKVENDNLNKLYRGIVLTFEIREKLELFINKLRKNKTEAFQYIVEKLKKYPKIFESWSYKYSVAEKFSKIRYENKFEIEDIQNISEKELEKVIDDIDSVSLVLEIPEKYFKNAMFHYELYDKYISEMYENAKKTFKVKYIRNPFELLPNKDTIKREQEIILFNTTQLIDETNIEKVAINRKPKPL